MCGAPLLWSVHTLAPAVALLLGPAAVPPSPSPPRVDGTYVGGTVAGALVASRVNRLSTPNPFGGVSGNLRIGEIVLPWLGLGLALHGDLAFTRTKGSPQRVGGGALLVEVVFVPVPRRPVMLRTGFGVGGGAIREDGLAGRSGFGGAAFTAGLRYEFFPGAARRRPRTAGGFALGPALDWVGFLPAARGRPTSHTVTLGLALTYYVGR